MSKHIYNILLAIFIFTLPACSRKDDPVTVPEDNVIAFGVSSHLVVESKNTTNDYYQQFGFVVMGAWSLDSWSDNELFGDNGTEVIYSATEGWDYSPKRYWKRGSYDFVGVMPSSLNTSLSTTSPGDRITLNFGNGGYNLAEGQDDIMVAFDADVDNSDGKMGTVVNGELKQVSFNFEHQLALVIIKAASMEARTDIRIDEIKVYGNHASTAGDIVTTYNGSNISSAYTLTGKTSKDNVYQTIFRPTESNVETDYDWMLAPKGNELTYDTLVPGLIVFPETCDFNIIVKYTDCYGDSEIQYTKTGMLPVNWETGRKYTYTFTISLDSIVFDEPTVEPWPTTHEKMDTDIEM